MPIVQLLAPLPPPVGGVATWTKQLLAYAQGRPAVRLLHLDTAVRSRMINDLRVSRRIVIGLVEGLRIARQLWLVLRRERPDVIHLCSSASFGLARDLVLVRIARYFGIPVVTHFHFGRIPELAARRNWEWRLLTAVVRQSRHTVVIDSPSLEALRASGFTQTSLIPNPVPADVPIADTPASAVEPGRILFVGHVLPTKGVTELVAAAAALPNTTLRLVGPVADAYRIELEALAAVRDGGEWLTLCGAQPRERVVEEMRLAAVVTLPSYTEGCPNVVLEAMALGKPIVASTVGAIPDLLGVSHDEPCGLCVPPRDTEALRAALTQMLADPVAAAGYGRRAWERARAEYAMEAIFSRYVALWQ